jgi:hypothetical protein
MVYDCTLLNIQSSIKKISLMIGSAGKLHVGPWGNFDIIGLPKGLKN